jgi:hypothetical protein
LGFSGVGVVEATFAKGVKAAYQGFWHLGGFLICFLERQFAI